MNDERIIKIDISHSEVMTIIASTYHQWRSEKEDSKYRREIKQIHKKLSVFVHDALPLYIYGEKRK